MRTVLSIWQRFGRRIFCGRTFGSRAQTISSVTCQQKSENVAAHDFVDKSLCEERRPPLNYSAFVSLLHLGIYFTHQTVWLTAADSLPRAVGIPTANICNYYSAHWKTEHCKYMSRKIIEFCAMIVSNRNFGNFQSWFSLKCGSLFPDQNYFLLVCLKVFKNTQTLIRQIKMLSRELSHDFNLIS